MVNRKKWSAMREDFTERATALLEELREAEEALQEHFDDKSERWQESEKGQEFESLIESVTDAADALEGFELGEWPL